MRAEIEKYVLKMLELPVASNAPNFIVSGMFMILEFYCIFKKEIQ